MRDASKQPVKGKLRGSLSVSTKLQLSRAARFSPNAARVLIVGEPGGGKGAAANDYHLLALERSWKGAGLDGKKKFLKNVAKRVVSIFELPDAQNLKNEELSDFFRSQIAGTLWWTWKKAKGKRCNCDLHLTPSNSAEAESPDSADSGSSDTGARGDSNNCDECPLLDGGACGIRGILAGQFDELCSKPANAPSLVLAFLSRLAGQLECIWHDSDDPSQDSKNPSKEAGFNFVQITCGSLGSEGTPLLAALKQLFGSGAGESSGFPLPGLFQLTAWMGGTLFLDEIADAPIPIQDNLLMALEEGRVCRLGWETVKEDVGNVRIVAATHKDLRKQVDLYRSTVTSGVASGFRPDLLTRLAQGPPVRVRPISDYFVYGEGEATATRDRLRSQFVAVMTAIMAMKAERARRRFWEALYDLVDGHIDRISSERLRFEPLDLLEKRKKLARKLSMRLFMSIVGMFEDSPRSKSTEELEGYILDRYLPEMLLYLASD